MIEPRDQWNQALVANVHPPHWVNPRPAPRYNLVVIGAGTAGLVTAAGAAGLGGRVALIERHLLGGDCLNYGCVPSKALLRAARAMAEARQAPVFGLSAQPDVAVDFARVMERMRRLRAQISPHDSARRFSELGVDVFLGDAKFVGSRTIEVNGVKLDFAKAVIATGARAVVPNIPGLRVAGCLTNESVFGLTQLPPELLVLGAGPIGCELAQAFRRFGAHVRLVEAAERILPREDPDASAIIDSALRRDGVELFVNARISEVKRRDKQKIAVLSQSGSQIEISSDEILVGVGRAPNVEGLNLEAAEVEYSAQGVRVDEHLRTTNHRIFAAGDICLPFKFTHTADAAARIVIQNALFGGRKKWTDLIVPWCTYTDPELAHVGMTTQEAEQRGVPVQTITQSMAEVDRAVLDGETEGLLKVHVRRGSDRILGATLVARHAGEMISELTLAITAGIGLKRIAQTIHCYPTQAEILKRAADSYNRSRLTPGLRKVFGRYFDFVRGA